VSYHWRGGRDARGLDLRPGLSRPPLEPPRGSGAQLTTDGKYEEPWSRQLPARNMVLTSWLPRSTWGAISSRFICGGCGEATPGRMAKVPGFLGDGEVTSL
jgi:hypothetical protein